MDTEEKARHIQEMINNPELSFKEIAGYFDFSTSSHFTAYCQRMFGMSPSELRKKIEINGLRNEEIGKHSNNRI